MNPHQQNHHSGNDRSLLNGWSHRPANRLRSFVRTLLAACLIVFTAAHALAQVGPGTAPVNPPAGGFGIEGDLGANVPNLGIGDWVPGVTGTGGHVLDGTALGLPLNPATTFHLTDLYDSGLDDNFDGGKKYFDDPTTWTWNFGNVLGKNDINNGLMHFTQDDKGHVWLVFASDRLSNNGAAYIDFEFLQNTLSVTGSGGGGFSSAGPNGGRTVGDFLLTLSLTQGGSTAGFSVERWESDGSVPLGFTYHDKTASVPAGAAYAAVNTTQVPVSFGAFGSNTYDTNKFVEGAVDLTALLATFDPCTSLGIKTLLIKCKTSQADTATITDFLAPLQLSLRLGVADAGPDQSSCSSTFTLAGKATPSSNVDSTTWTVVSGSAVIDNANSLTTSVTVTSSPATLRLTVVTKNGCSATDEVVLTVTPGPELTETHTDVKCFGESNGTIDLTVNGGASPYTYLWSNGAKTEDLTGLNAGTYTVTVTDKNGCTASTSVTIAEPTLLTAGSSATPIACNGGNSTVTVVASGGTAPYTGTGDFVKKAGTHTFTVTDKNGCTASTTVTITEPTMLAAGSSATPIACNGGDSTVTVVASGGTPPYTGTGDFVKKAGTHTFTVTDKNGCTASTTVTITEPTLLTAGSSATPIACNGGDSTVTVVASGGTAPYTGTGTFTRKAGTHTFTVTDNNGCMASTKVTITEPALLQLTLTKVDPSCTGNDGSITAVATGGTPPLLYSIDGGTTYQTSPEFLNLAAGPYTVQVKDANDCMATASKTLDIPLCNGRILPTGTTCAQYYPVVTVADLTTLCFGLRAGKINNVAPGVLFYYTQLVAPAPTFTVDIRQLVSPAGFKLLNVHQDQVIVYDTNCTRQQAVVLSGNSAKTSIEFKSAIPGATYIISVKYSPDSAVGQPATATSAWTYNFRTYVNGTGVDGTKNGIVLKFCR